MLAAAVGHSLTIDPSGHFRLDRQRTWPNCDTNVMGQQRLGIVLATDANMAGAYCALSTIFPKVISGLRKPIAIRAAISFNISLPE